MFKKIAAAFLIALTLCQIPVSADDTIVCDLPMINDTSIIIDGKNDESFWQNAAKVELRQDNTGMWAGMTSQEHYLPVDAYFLWCESGVFVYADVADNDPVYNGANDCFEVSFNPGGLIPKEDELQGMFFMMWPAEDGEVWCTRHNISEETKAGIEAEDVEARWTQTDDGWAIEALIPWEYICDETRPVYVSKRRTAPLLKDFEVKEGAFLTATVCRLNGDENTQYCAVYRTCTNNDGANFYTDSYNVRFNLGAYIDTPVETAPEATNNNTAKVETSTDTANDTPSNDTSNTPYIVLGIVAGCVVLAAVIILIVFLKRKK